MVETNGRNKTSTKEFGLVAVYSVGILSAIQHDLRRIKSRGKDGPRRSQVARKLRYIRYQLKRGNFRAVRMTFNGYLAEPVEWPGALSRCGSGWTKKRALRSLHRHACRRGYIR